MGDHTHKHGHVHGHEHQHGHSHQHQHGEHKAHSHSSGKTTDQWVGKDYLNYPGLYVSPSPASFTLTISRELAKTNHDTTIQALVSAGIPKDTISTLSLLEVGCGELLNPVYLNETDILRCRSCHTTPVQIVQICPRH
jgi:hypothetical protein